MSDSAVEYDCVTCGDTVDIVELVSHGCEHVLSADEMSSSERSTLLYVESMIVDNGARLDTERMNHEDHQNLKLFRAAGLLDTEPADGQPVDELVLNVTEFSHHAWGIAAECRRLRGIENLPDGGGES